VDELGGGCIAIAVGLAIAAWVISMIVMAVMYVLAGIYCIFIGAIMVVLAVLDGATSASLFASAPAVMWAIWGAIIGGALAFWLVAPLYGLRKQRPLIAGAPFALMGAVALLAQTLK
jgi:hypothetical protein